MKKSTLTKTSFLFLLMATVVYCQAFASTGYFREEIVISATENTDNDETQIPGHMVVKDNYSFNGMIILSVPFEVIPGEEVSYDIRIWNESGMVNSSEVVLRLDFPNNINRVLFAEDVTLMGYEAITVNNHSTIPENIQVFGRYTMKLYIDNRLADFFQFDLNSRGLIEVRWDDGIMVNAWAFDGLCSSWAIRGCLPEGAILDSVGTYILSEGDPYWPWPDDIHQDILLKVYDNDGPGGMPGTLLWSDVSRVTPGTSHAVAYPGIPISSAFYIVNDQITEYPDCEGQGVDIDVNHPDQMFIRTNSDWENAGDQYGGDFMIWGVGYTADQRITIGNLPVE
jgi:hypothetical protein